MSRQIISQLQFLLVALPLRAALLAIAGYAINIYLNTITIQRNPLSARPKKRP